MEDGTRGLFESITPNFIVFGEWRKERSQLGQKTHWSRFEQVTVVYEPTSFRLHQRVRPSINLPEVFGFRSWCCINCKKNNYLRWKGLKKKERSCDAIRHAWKHWKTPQRTSESRATKIRTRTVRRLTAQDNLLKHSVSHGDELARIWKVTIITSGPQDMSSRPFTGTLSPQSNCFPSDPFRRIIIGLLQTNQLLQM